MSFVTAATEMIETAATDVAAIGSTLSAAHLTAASATIGLIPAAADEVSTGISQLFSQYAQDYQAVAAQATAFQQQFAQRLSASAASYTATEAVNAAAAVDLQSIITSIAGAPGGLIGSLTKTFTTIEGVMLAYVESAVLSAYVLEELFVFSYITLAILIGLEELVLNYLGITIALP